MGRTSVENRKIVFDFGTCLKFDGVNDEVTLNRAYGLPLFINTNCTLSMWIKNEDLSQLGKKLYAEGNSAATGASLEIGTGSAAGQSKRIKIFARKNDNSIILNTVSTNDVLTNNNWNHLVVTDTNGSLVVYLNNVQVMTASYSKAAFTPNRCTIGAIRITDTPTAFFKGKIDKVRMWSRVLTNQEMTDLYYSDKVIPTNLVAEYLFNEGSGTTANDNSVNENTGTISGAVYSSDVVTKPRTDSGVRNAI